MFWLLENVFDCENLMSLMCVCKKFVYYEFIFFDRQKTAEMLSLALVAFLHCTIHSNKSIAQCLL